MPFTLFDDENYLRTQRELAALGPSAVAILQRYLAGAPASEMQIYNRDLALLPGVTE